MDQVQFAAYLTYEFSNLFTPEMIKESLESGNIKIFFCDNTGMPIFEYGKYTGPLSSLGLPKIAAPTIQISINPFQVLSELTKLTAQEKNKEEINRHYQLIIISKVFKQILKQVHQFTTQFQIGKPLHSAALAHTDEVNSLLNFIGKEHNHATKVYH